MTWQDYQTWKEQNSEALKKKPAHFEVAKILDGALTLKVEKIFPPEGKLYFSIYGDENKFLAHDKIWSTRSRRRSAAGNSTQ